MNQVQAITEPVCFGKVGGFEVGVLSMQRLWRIQLFGNVALLIATLVDVCINPRSQNITAIFAMQTSNIAIFAYLSWHMYTDALLRSNWDLTLCSAYMLSFVMAFNIAMQVTWIVHLFLRGSPELGVVVLVCTCFFFLLPYAIFTQHYRLLKHIHLPDAVTATAVATVAATPKEEESVLDSEQAQCVVIVHAL
jgi:hypothetical protein